MAITNRCLIEQTWYMANETVSVSVNDADGTNTRSITAVGAWYRTRLVASGATAGTLINPHSLTAKFQAALNTAHSYYGVRYQADGTIGITYNGTGTAVITWGTNGAKLRRMLGFGEDATTSIASNATASGTYHPCGSVLSGALSGAGYTTRAAGIASEMAPDGYVYTVSAQANTLHAKRSLLYHPLTWGARTALSEHATPIFAGPSSALPSVASALSFVQPWSACAGSGGGIWSVLALMSTGIYSIAMCPHDFQTIRTTTHDDVLVAWLMPETLRNPALQSLSIPNFTKRCNWDDFELSIIQNITVGSP